MFAVGEMYEVFDKQRFRDGFVYRLLKLPAIIINPPAPTLVELQRFQASGPREVGEDGEAEVAPNLAEQFKTLNEIRQKRAILFQRDDKVMVIEGELKNLVGRVVEVKGEEIRVQPLYDAISEQPLKLPVIPLAPHQ